MAEEGTSPEWYYVGHYGQLGPLTLEQMNDLIADGVIDHETYVWKNGMADWSPAASVTELASKFQGTPPAGPYSTEIQPPVFDPTKATQIKTDPSAQYNPHQPYSPVTINNYITTPKSDKSRIAAGVLNILPGFGRFYLGYAAHGVLQLLTSFCGVGLIWSWLDGLYIMVGGVKYDGYGRVIED